MSEFKIMGVDSVIYSYLANPTREAIQKFAEERMVFAMTVLMDNEAGGVLLPEVGMHLSNGQSKLGVLVEGDEHAMLLSFLREMTGATAICCDAITAYHTMIEAWVTKRPYEKDEDKARMDAMELEDLDSYIDKIREDGTRSECIIIKVYSRDVGNLTMMQGFGRGMNGKPLFTQDNELFWNNKGDEGVTIRDFAKEAVDRSVFD